METIDCPVAIIGGGIVGAGLARDLALHNIPFVLIERGRIASQTSSRSSKMLHGGIRYLEHLEFNLVREALLEKNLWLNLAPKYASEMPFCVPVYKNSKAPLWQLSVGMKLYDLLSGYKNSPHKILSTEQTLERYGLLKKEGLKGSGVYFDAIMDDKMLAVSCIDDAKALIDNQIFEDTRLIEHKKLNDHSLLTLDNGQKIKAKYCVFCVGPFTDQVMQDVGIPWNNVLAPSKGIHLWIDKKAFPLTGPIVLQIKDGRIIFVIPREKGVLVGTTESTPEKDFFNIEARPDEIKYLLNCLNEFFPAAKIENEHIIDSYAGVRPLVMENSSSRNNLGSISREHKIFMPYPNVEVIVGGKYTTFRVMVQETARRLVQGLGKSYSPLKAKAPLVQ